MQMCNGVWSAGSSICFTRKTTSSSHVYLHGFLNKMLRKVAIDLKLRKMDAKQVTAKVAKAVG